MVAYADVNADVKANNKDIAYADANATVPLILFEYKGFKDRLFLNGKTIFL